MRERDPTHGAGVGAIQIAAIVGRLRSVALVESSNVGTLRSARTGGELLGALERRSDLRKILGIQRRIDVGPQDEGDSPPAHGAFRVLLGGGAERPRRLEVVEAPCQVEALVEEALSLG